MERLQKDMSRQEAEAVLGLMHSRTNDGMIWKFPLTTNQSIFLWFYSPCDPATGLRDTNITRLLSATFDFQSVTSRIADLRMGMSLAELESALGIREAISWFGSSSGVSLDYMFDDPEGPQNEFPTHELIARLSTPHLRFMSTNETETAAWIRTNGSLVWLWIDGKPFHPPQRRPPER